jgi:hypothetical protein
MELFIISIPFMVLAVAIAVVPLLVMSRLHRPLPLREVATPISAVVIDGGMGHKEPIGRAA